MALGGWHRTSFESVEENRTFVRFGGKERACQVLKKTGMSEACDAIGETYIIPPETQVVLIEDHF
jgi:environmental stress-induced protein Ves